MARRLAEPEPDRTVLGEGDAEGHRHEDLQANVQQGHEAQSDAHPNQPANRHTLHGDPRAYHATDQLPEPAERGDTEGVQQKEMETGVEEWASLLLSSYNTLPTADFSGLCRENLKPLGDLTPRLGMALDHASQFLGEMRQQVMRGQLEPYFISASLKETESPQDVPTAADPLLETKVGETRSLPSQAAPKRWSLVQRVGEALCCWCALRKRLTSNASADYSKLTPNTPWIKRASERERVPKREKDRERQ